MAAASMTSLSRRGAAAEEAFYKQEQELRVLSLRKALEATPSGRLRLAACEASAPPPRADSMLPAIARQYLRLDTPQLVEKVKLTTGNGFRNAGHIIAGVCTGSPLFVRDTSLGGSLSTRGSKWVAASTTVEGVSLFDIKGAVKLMEGSQSPLPKQVVLPQHQSAVLRLGSLNLKLLPDLTPNRALLWGTVLAVWSVAGVTLKSARSLGIHSVEDVRMKCADALEPMALRLDSLLLPFREKLAISKSGLKDSELTQRLRATMR